MEKNNIEGCNSISNQESDLDPVNLNSDPKLCTGTGCTGSGYSTRRILGSGTGWNGWVGYMVREERRAWY